MIVWLSDRVERGVKNNNPFIRVWNRYYSVKHRTTDWTGKRSQGQESARRLRQITRLADRKLPIGTPSLLA